MAEEKDKAKPAAEKTAPVAADKAAPEGDAAAAKADGAAPAAGAPADGAARAPRVKAKGARHVPYGIAYVTSTFNNTIVTITDPKGGVVVWNSAGRAGFKGSRRSTAFAASVVGQEAARQAVSRGMREVEVRVQGPGAGRESAIRALQAAGMTVTVIKDVTPMPHDGCRPRKRRRV